jgi:hypothetical protein
MSNNGSNALVPQFEGTSDKLENRNAVVPHKSSADVVEVESADVPNLAGAVAQLQNVLSSMRPDDFSLEFEQDRVRTRFRLRAYKHGR